MKEAQRHISSAEFAEWMAYDRLEPIGPRRADLNAAIIAASVYNARRTKRSDKVADPKQFMPTYWKPEPEPATAEEMFEQVKALNAMLGGDFVGEA